MNPDCAYCRNNYNAKLKNQERKIKNQCRRIQQLELMVEAKERQIQELMDPIIRMQMMQPPPPFVISDGYVKAKGES